MSKSRHPSFRGQNVGRSRLTLIVSDRYKMQKAPFKGLKAICHYVLNYICGTDETATFNIKVLLEIINSIYKNTMGRTWAGGGKPISAKL